MKRLMINKELMAKSSGCSVANFTCSCNCFGGTVLQSRCLNTAKYVLRIKFVLEILIFFVFSAFVVFGIKGFFEMYSQSKMYHLYLGILLALLSFYVIKCFQE
jgi:hypothetical protein